MSKNKNRPRVAPSIETVPQNGSEFLPKTAADRYIDAVSDVLRGVKKRAQKKELLEKSGVPIFREEPRFNKDDASLLAAEKSGAFLWRKNHRTHFVLHQQTVDGNGYLLRIEQLDMGKEAASRRSRVVSLDAYSQPVLKIRETMTGEGGHDWGYAFFRNGEVAAYRPGSATEGQDGQWVMLPPESDHLKVDLSIVDGDLRYELIGSEDSSHN
jgi:hypothetical protein